MPTHDSMPPDDEARAVVWIEMPKGSIRRAIHEAAQSYRRWEAAKAAVRVRPCEPFLPPAQQDTREGGG